MQNFIIRATLSVVLTANILGFAINTIVENSQVMVAGLWKPLIPILLMLLMGEG